MSREIVKHRFLYWLLADEKEGVIRFTPEGGSASRWGARQAVAGVAELHLRAASGEKVLDGEWVGVRGAAYAAYAAADAAAYAAAAAAAADAADYWRDAREKARARQAEVLWALCVEFNDGQQISLAEL